MYILKDSAYARTFVVPMRQCFRLLRELRAQLRQDAPDGIDLRELSMGMSGDFEAAVEEGAIVVRVGRAIFGARRTPDEFYPPDVPAESEQHE